MRTSYNRRTATKVVHGETRAKNRHVPTTHRGYVIDREPPGRGYRHVVTKRDLQDFIDLVPDWRELSRRLDRIVLDGGSEDSDGCHIFYHRGETGAVYLHAWDHDLWQQLPLSYFGAHQEIFQRFGVSFDLCEEHVICRFMEQQARAFLLLHVFMHELGHHWDRIHQKHRKSERGEDYAERFANDRFQRLFPRYVRTFGHPANGAA